MASKEEHKFFCFFTNVKQEEFISNLSENTFQPSL